MRQIAVVVSIACCLLAATARADFAAGVSAYDRGDYTAAYEAWLPLAKDGDAAAQRNLAHLYRFGFGITQNFEQAANWYRQAAETGLAGAQANLAMMYLRGQGLEENPRRAAYWFEQAAVQGHPVAQYNLALLYLRGLGVGRNEAKAMAWLNLAAKVGHQPSLDALSKLILNANKAVGPPQRHQVQALVPSQNKPVAKVEPPARSTPGYPGPTEAELTNHSAMPDSYHASAADRRRLSDALVALHAGQTDNAQNELFELARAGMAAAQYHLGLLHKGVGGGPVDRARAYAWLVLAAERGYPKAESMKQSLFPLLTSEERQQSHAMLRAWRAPS